MIDTGRAIDTIENWPTLWAGLDVASTQLPLGDDFFGPHFEDSVRKRKFKTFRALVSPRNKLEEFFLELFILARSHRKVLGYLSVQEGENFDAPVEGFDTNAPIVVRDLLRRVGRSSQLRYTHSVFGFRLLINLDPTIFLRRLYWDTVRPSLLSKVLGLRSVRKLRFRTTCWLLSRVGARLRDGISGDRKSESIKAFIDSKAIDRPIAMLLMIIFPGITQDWSHETWSRLLGKVKNYLKHHIPVLADTISRTSGNNRGYIKLAKVAFGVLVGRSAYQSDASENPLEYIFDSVRLAYSWGITYPLVDNVIDDPKIPSETKKAVLTLVGQIFSTSHNPDTVSKLNKESPLIAELTRRLVEVRGLIGTGRREQVFRAIQSLIKSHRSDAEHSLYEVSRNDNLIDAAQILVNAASKAAAIRLATLAICGGEIDKPTISRYLNRGFFNQLGDDIWDISEDCEDDRVTPVSFAKVKNNINPVSMYLQYASWLVDGERKLRRSAALAGCCETLRDSIQGSEDRDEMSYVSELVHETLAVAGIKDVASLLAGVPPVDTDSTLFLLEDAIKECASVRQP